jgi:hemerythrin-like domain-containing protein
MTTERPTDSLRAEHAAVLKKLDALERIVAHPDKQQETTTELRTLAAFFQTEFWVHFTKEEEALFPEMGKYTLVDKGPLGVMLREHVELRASNELWQAAVAGYLANVDGAEFIVPMKENATHFVWMLRDHINKEDNMLFVMAEQWLKPNEKQNVARLFLEIEAEEKAAVK